MQADTLSVSACIFGIDRRQRARYLSSISFGLPPVTNKNLVTISCNTALSANVDALMERLGTHNRPELFKLGLYALAQQLAQAENCETPPSLAEVQENLRRLVPGAGSFRAFCGRKEEAAKPAAK